MLHLLLGTAAPAGTDPVRPLPRLRTVPEYSGQFNKGSEFTCAPDCFETTNSSWTSSRDGTVHADSGHCIERRTRPHGTTVRGGGLQQCSEGGW